MKGHLISELFARWLTNLASGRGTLDRCEVNLALAQLSLVKNKQLSAARLPDPVVLSLPTSRAVASAALRGDLVITGDEHDLRELARFVSGVAVERLR